MPSNDAVQTIASRSKTHVTADTIQVKAKSRPRLEEEFEVNTREKKHPKYYLSVVGTGRTRQNYEGLPKGNTWVQLAARWNPVKRISRLWFRALSRSPLAPG